MAIAPDSSSYPILGAARAWGVRYGLALDLALAIVTARGEAAAMAAIAEAHGWTAAMELLGALIDAEGRGVLAWGPVA